MTLCNMLNLQTLYNELYKTYVVKTELIQGHWTFSRYLRRQDIANKCKSRTTKRAYLETI